MTGPPGIFWEQRRGRVGPASAFSSHGHLVVSSGQARGKTHLIMSDDLKVIGFQVVQTKL